MKLAFLGFGTIGRMIYSEILSGNLAGIDAIAVKDPQLSASDVRMLEKQGIRVCHSLDQLIHELPDFILEAANQEVAQKSTPLILRKGINVISLSVGAYLNEDVMREINNCPGSSKLYLPSGAMPCIDAIKGAAIRNIDRVHLTTRKHPKALTGALGLAGLDIENLSNSRVVFEGSAKEAVTLFPKNVNVAATVSLAGVGPSKTKVTIVADPSLKHNIHELELSGQFGTYFMKIENLPCENPKTSLMAALSAIALLKGLVSKIQVGT